MKYIYTAVITPSEDRTFFVAEVPDIHSCVTTGKTLEEAVKMITDAASGCLVVAEDEEIPISAPTPQNEISRSPDSVCTLIVIDTYTYRIATDNRAVRKNVSLPAWMVRMADKKGLNCSQILQDALEAKFSAL